MKACIRFILREEDVTVFSPNSLPKYTLRQDRMQLLHEVGPQDKVCESSSYSFPLTCQGGFFRHVPSGQIAPSEIIVVTQLFLPHKPTFVNSLGMVGSAL